MMGTSPKKNEQQEQQKMLQDLEQEFYLELKGQVSEMVNAGTRVRYEKIFNLDSQDKSELTKEEIEEIAKRKRIEEDLMDTDAYRHTQMNTDKYDSKFL